MTTTSHWERANKPLKLSGRAGVIFVRSTRRRCGLAVALTLAVAGTACSDSDECTWGVEAVVEEFSNNAAEVTDCGSFGSWESARVESALACVESPMHQAAKVTVNYCLDCSVPHSHLRTSDGKHLEIRMEADHFGDDRREIVVSECRGFQFNAGGASDLITCLESAEIYSCSEAVRDN